MSEAKTRVISVSNQKELGKARLEKSRIVYNNELNDCSFMSLSVLEMDIFFAVISLLKFDDSEVRYIDYRQLRKLIPRKLKNKEHVMDSLRKADKVYQEETGRKDGFFKKIGFNEGKFFIEVTDYLSYLLKSVRSNYTSMSLSAFTEINSIYAKAIFRKMSQFRNTKCWRVSPKQLREYLCIDEKVPAAQLVNQCFRPAARELSDRYKLKIAPTKKYGRIIYFELFFEIPYEIIEIHKTAEFPEVPDVISKEFYPFGFDGEIELPQEGKSKDTEKKYDFQRLDEFEEGGSPMIEDDPETLELFRQYFDAVKEAAANKGEESKKQEEIKEEAKEEAKGETKEETPANPPALEEIVEQYISDNPEFAMSIIAKSYSDKLPAEPAEPTEPTEEESLPQLEETDAIASPEVQTKETESTSEESDEIDADFMNKLAKEYKEKSQKSYEDFDRRERAGEFEDKILFGNSYVDRSSVLPQEPDEINDSREDTYEDYLSSYLIEERHIRNFSDYEREEHHQKHRHYYEGENYIERDDGKWYESEDLRYDITRNDPDYNPPREILGAIVNKDGSRRTVFGRSRSNVIPLDEYGRPLDSVSQTIAKSKSTEQPVDYETEWTEEELKELSAITESEENDISRWNRGEWTESDLEERLW